jgi:tRNA U34 2-thiouridine synthase MnmA/TrmU
MKTLLLLSGGLDSTVVLADLLKKGRDVETLTFKYGQTHPVEIEKAKIIADLYNVPNTLYNTVPPFYLTRVYAFPPLRSTAHTHFPLLPAVLADFHSAKLISK